MANPTRLGWRATLILITVVASGGCSRLPTAPRSDVETGTSRSPGVWAESSPQEPIELPDLLPPGDGESSSDETAVLTGESNVLVYGKTGGQISAGDFTVIIPPEAISGNVRVTIRQPDLTKPYVALDIWPRTKNSFDVPVTLVADASRMSPEALKQAVISWYNPATGEWEPMAATQVDVEARTVKCPLSHFSEYAVQVDGKAGW